MTVSNGPQHQKIFEFGAKVRFGKTSNDYARHRAGFPDDFFDLMANRNWVRAGQKALDLGTGTGTVAAGLHQRGCHVTGTDPSEDMLKAAQQLSPDIHFQCCTAEDLPFADCSFDLVTAGQCWHWFDRATAARQAHRVLRPGGRIVIAHFDWLPLKGNLVSATERLILKHNPDWAASGGTGIYPAWLTDLDEASFTKIETASFDVSQPYTPSAWRGRIRASAGVAASLSPHQVEVFDAELSDLLKHNFPQDVISVPHRVWVATAQKA